MRRAITILIAFSTLACLYASSFYNYLLFHSLAEGFSVVICCGVFMVTWNTRRFAKRDYLLLIGVAYLFVGILDFVHTLSYSGMNVITGFGPNAPTQLWIAARYLESLSLLAAPFMLRRRGTPIYYILFYATVSALVVLSIFVWRIFPDCYLPGTGLTRFKIVSEYIICLILVAAGTILLQRREHFERGFLGWTLSSIAVTILSELAFTTYASVFGFANLLGHILKIVSFYLIYKAVIEISLTRPYDLLFKDLNRQRERFRVTLTSIGDAVIATDAEGRITFMNPMAEFLTGWVAGEAENRLISNVFHIVDKQTGHPVKDPLTCVVRENRKGTAIDHTAIIAKDGGSVPIENSAAPIKAANGQLSGFVLIFRDISERKQAEQSLRESEAKYRNLFENMTEEVHFWRLIRDESGQIKSWRLVDVNPPALKSWGRKSAAEIKGKTTDEIFGPGATEHYLPIVQKIMDEGVPHSFEDYFPHLDKYFRFTSVPLGDHFITTGADITDIKKAEEKIKESLAEKEVLLKEIHHRVKNNMQVISSLVDLQADDVKDAEMREIFKDVIYRVRSMAMVHEKLYQSTDLARVEFADYAQSLLDYLWRAQGPAGRDIQLDFDLDPVLLPVNTAVPCGLILNELFSNALKHAFKGRDSGKVSVSLHKNEQGRVRLDVNDNGSGMPRKIDWQNAATLGLRLVRMLAGQLHATVEMQSGQGTEYTIIFDVPQS